MEETQETVSENPTSSETTEQAPTTALGGASDPLTFDPTTLPDGLDREPSLRNFDSVDKLAKSYVHAVKKMGVPPEQMVKIPSDDTTWNETYSALGRPEGPNGYDFSNYEDEGSDLSRFKEMAFEAGLNQGQSEIILDTLKNEYLNNEKGYEEHREQEEVQGLQALQKQWGPEFNKNLNLAQRVFNRFADKDTLDYIEETGVGNNPNMIKMLARIGEAFSEGGPILTGEPRGSGLSPQEAKETIQAKLSDPDFKRAYLTASDPNHKEAVKTMQRLYDKSA